MSGSDLPDQPVPDKVLEELLAVFGTNDASIDVGTADPSVTYDFDDPSIDRLLGVETAATEVLSAPPADDPPSAKKTIDLTGIEEVGAGAGDRSPMPTGSTRREAKAAARADVKAVKAATRDASKSAKASSKATAKASKQEAKEAAKAAKRGEPPKPTVAPIDPLTPKPVVAREQVLVGVAAGASTARRTIVIADDDQPGDTLYLGEDAEQRLREIHASSPAGGQRSTIVIDATDHGVDTVSTTQASPNIDPRLRARRLAVHRAASRRRLLWVGIAMGIVLLVVGVVATLASPLFDVRDIEVQGNQYTDPALIEHVRQEMRGEPILLVDTTRLERELETSPWVESARVTTDFPHHVLVDIRERKPVATFAGSDGSYRVIDRNGQVLAVLDGRPIDYMLLTGNAPDSEPGQFAGTAYAAAAQLVIALPPEIKRITSSVGVDATTNELTLELDAPEAEGVHVRLGTVTGIEDKLARLVVLVRDGLKPGQQLDVATAEVGS